MVISDSTEKIAKSGLFLVLGDKGYLAALRRGDERIWSQVKLARKLKKPTILVIDKRLLKSEVIELERYFHRHDVIKEIEVNPCSEESKIATKNEIERLIRERMKDDDESIEYIS